MGQRVAPVVVSFDAEFTERATRLRGGHREYSRHPRCAPPRRGVPARTPADSPADDESAGGAMGERLHLPHSLVLQRPQRLRILPPGRALRWCPPGSSDEPGNRHRSCCQAVRRQLAADRSPTRTSVVRSRCSSRTAFEVAHPVRDTIAHLVGLCNITAETPISGATTARLTENSDAIRRPSSLMRELPN